MRKSLIRLLIYTKAYTKTYSFIIFMILLFAGCFIISRYDLKSYEPLKAGIYIEDNNSFNNELRKNIDRKNDFIIYDEENLLYRDVNNGSIYAGFSVKDNLLLKEYDLNNYKVDFIASTYSVSSEAYKEMFFDAFFECYNNYLIKDLADEIFENSNEALKSELIELKDKYQNSDELFDVNITYLEGSRSNASYQHNFIKGLISIIIFIGIVFNGANLYDAQYLALFMAMNRREQIINRFLLYSSSAIPLGICGLTAQILFQRDSITTNIIKLVFLIIYSIIWGIILNTCIKSKRIYISLITLSVPVMLLICPIVINMGIYIPALKVIKYIFPVSVYL